MTTREVLAAYLPSILLVGFGATLAYLAFIISNIHASYCPTGPVSQCIDVGVQNQIETISAWLFFTGIAVTGLSAALSAVTYRMRNRRPVSRKPTPDIP